MWISTKDSLPDLGVVVIITDGTCSYCACRDVCAGYDYQIVDGWDTKSYEFEKNAINSEYVTHWMPLPDGPQLKK